MTDVTILITLAFAVGLALGYFGGRHILLMELKKLNSSFKQLNKTIYKNEQIVFNTRAEAEKVLDELLSMMELYGWVSVVDFNDLVGINSSYRDMKHGWTNLNNIKISRVKHNNIYGYTLDLPEAMSEIDVGSKEGTI